MSIFINIFVFRLFCFVDACAAYCADADIPLVKEDELRSYIHTLPPAKKSWIVKYSLTVVSTSES